MFFNLLQISDGVKASAVPLPLPSNEKIQFATCLKHEKLPLSFFCEICTQFICGECIHTLHRDHTVFIGQHKIQEQQMNLNSFLDTWKKSGKKAKKQAEELKNCIAYVDKSYFEEHSTALQLKNLRQHLIVH